MNLPGKAGVKHQTNRVVSFGEYNVHCRICVEYILEVYIMGGLTYDVRKRCAICDPPRWPSGVNRQALPSLCKVQDA